MGPSTPVSLVVTSSAREALGDPASGRSEIVGGAHHAKATIAKNIKRRWMGISRDATLQNAASKQEQTSGGTIREAALGHQGPLRGLDDASR
jgi:hypothetical protein